MVISGTTSPRPTPTSTPQPIREWEIWNEPNSSNFWSPKPDPAAYAELIKRSAKTLDKADPKAQVMSGGMFATPQSDGAIVSYDFIEQLYAQDGVDDAIDIVGVHPVRARRRFGHHPGRGHP